MRELEGTLTRKGQVTIPAAIRSRLGLKPRDKVPLYVGRGRGDPATGSLDGTARLR